MRDSSICGEVLIHKNSSPSLKDFVTYLRPYGSSFLELSPCFATSSRTRREETLRKKTTHENLLHISVNFAVSHVWDGILDCSIRSQWILLKTSVMLIRFRCRTFCILTKVVNIYFVSRIKVNTNFNRYVQCFSKLFIEVLWG